MEVPELTGTLFDIQGFSVHDGPGCRTLIFLKGCSLSCVWCSNPEGKHPYPEPLFYESKCIADELCIGACPSVAISRIDKRLNIDRLICSSCKEFDCIDACCTGALRKGGYRMSLSKLYALINRDRQYWGEKGGITLTGGEPFFQPEFTTRLLRKCHDAYIHTAAETCGNVPYSHYTDALPYLDWIFYDLKHMDPDEHRRLTGHTNISILENARRLSREFDGRMIFRMVVIPGINSSPDHISKVARFIQETKRTEINLLPLHHLGSGKYSLIGLPYYTDDFSLPDISIIQEVRNQFISFGIDCYIGSNTPF